MTPNDRRTLLPINGIAAPVRIENAQRIAKTVIKWLLTILAVGFVARFIITNLAAFPALYTEWRARGDQGWTVLALVTCYVLSWLVVAAQFYFPLRRLNANVGFTENAALIIGGALLNYSPFKAGVLYRFYYFKRWHDISYTTLAGLQLLRVLLTVGASGLFGLVAFAFAIAGNGNANWALLSIFGLMTFGGSVAVAIAPRLARRLTGPISRFATELVRGINELRRSLKLTLILFGLIGCQFGVLIVQYKIIFFVLGLEPPVVAYLVLVPLITMLGMVSITPGNLGLREIAIAMALSLSDVSFRSGMFVGLMDRGAITVATIAFGSLSLIYLVSIRRSRTTKAP
jgi:uncharacterized membrane protein YbhN (UPF0104 family)